jgi:hypothetical protein
LLTDPWLVGDLTFADIDWLYKGVKRTKPQGSVSDVTLGVDFLLISQVSHSINISPRENQRTQ